MNYYTKETKLGRITITEEFGFITSLFLKQKVFRGKFDKNFLSESIEKAFTQLEEYFDGKRKEFDIPLNPKGTSFQQKVWSCLYKIPYGETRTYKEIATQIGNENSSRAVGSANNKNPIPIFIPCHRVVGSNGDLVGYAYGIDLKQKLLELEKLNQTS